MPKVSVVLRTKNESNFLRNCAKSILNQGYKGQVEIVIVDNCSIDGTSEIARTFATRFLEIFDYTPGRALNLGVRNSSGDYCVFTSAHCLPEVDWLEKLIHPFMEFPITGERPGGVYGRQLPDETSEDIDVKDLWTVFGPEPRVQRFDPFFHNANSAVSRKLLEAFPFHDLATNVEDRLWAKLVQSNGYYIYYEPEARVFHAHGINHHENKSHAEKVVSVLRQHKVYE